MQEIKKALAYAVIKMLKPLARILIRHGISHKEFSEYAKKAFIDTAKKDFTIPGKKQTHARIAILTGLSRKEVIKFSHFGKHQIPENSQTNRAIRVIGGWLSDPEFFSDSKPNVLMIHGKSNSFHALVKKYSGDISANAVLDELLNSGSITYVDNSSIALVDFGYTPDANIAEKINVVGNHMSDFLDTIDNNLTKDASPYFQREVIYSGIAC